VARDIDVSNGYDNLPLDDLAYLSARNRLPEPHETRYREMIAGESFGEAFVEMEQDVRDQGEEIKALEQQVEDLEEEVDDLEDRIDANSLTKVELRAILDERGVKYKTGDDKAALVSLIADSDDD
jgi:TolA-binding protein